MIYLGADCSWAAGTGHEGVVKSLLEQDANPEQTDSSGPTPLSWAFENGYEGVVKTLLGQENVDPDRADTKYGRTPLSWAFGIGREGVVRVLLVSLMQLFQRTACLMLAAVGIVYIVSRLYPIPYSPIALYTVLVSRGYTRHIFPSTKYKAFMDK